jgi:hypothetical protein
LESSGWGLSIPFNERTADHFGFSSSVYRSIVLPEGNVSPCEAANWIVNDTDTDVPGVKSPVGLTEICETLNADTDGIRTKRTERKTAHFIIINLFIMTLTQTAVLYLHRT